MLKLSRNQGGQFSIITPGQFSVVITKRLQSHLIPVEELANGGYEGLTDEQKKEKLEKDFKAFIQKRAELVVKAVTELVNGHQLSASTIFMN